VKRRSALLVAALLLSATAARLQVGAADSETSLDALERRYRAVVSFTATFTQTYRAPGIETVESGVVAMKRPALMRWEYRRPESKLFVADGKKTYLYSPADRQVMVARFSERELRSTPLEFLLGGAGLVRGFRPTAERELQPKLEGTSMLRLEPRSPQSEYDSIVLEFDSRTFEIRRLVVREATGGSSDFLFSDTATNVRLDDRQFQFHMPKGVEVIELDEGRE